MDQAIEMGYCVREYHRIPSPDDLTMFSVTLSEADCFDVVCDADTGTLATALKVTPEVLESSSIKPHLTFKRAVEDGYRVISFTKHFGKDMYSVWMALDQAIEVFGKITAAHLREIAGPNFSARGNHVN